jgi:hypothetical protein
VGEEDQEEESALTIEKKMATKKIQMTEKNRH